MEFVRLSVEDQPEILDFACADGILIKSMILRKIGTYVPQHSHKYDHTSFIAIGAVRLWCDAELIGDIHAPKPIEIKAHKKHLFMTLEDNTVILCIHNGYRSGEIEIHEEHQIT